MRYRRTPLLQATEVRPLVQHSSVLKIKALPKPCHGNPITSRRLEFQSYVGKDAGIYTVKILCECPTRFDGKAHLKGYATAAGELAHGGANIAGMIIIPRHGSENVEVSRTNFIETSFGNSERNGEGSARRAFDTFTAYCM